MFTPLDFVSLVRNQVAAIQSMANSAQDFAIGSILRAIVQSNSSVVLTLQSFILQVLTTIRASTCSGDDLDTWMSDFGVYRVAAVQATGYVTFSRFTFTRSALVPVGSTVETLDGSQQYTVIADPSNVNYDNAQGGYVIAAGVASIDIPVQANLAGTAANAQIGNINTLTSSIVGVDTVYNANGFVNGQDKETDDDLRARFVLYLSSLSKGTKSAIINAILSVKSDANYALIEGYDHAGNFKPGYFYVVVDDGTGAPSANFISRIIAAVDLVRAFTVTFNVFAPTLVYVDVSLTLTLDKDFDADSAKALVQNAISEYLQTNKLGIDALYYKIPQLAFDASPAVLNVSNVTLNGGTSDVVLTDAQLTQPGTITVN